MRLALWALARDYGKKNLVYSGPRLESSRFEGAEAHISFDHTGGGLVFHGGGELQGFAVAGPDRKFHPANARIAGDSIVVKSAAVARAIAVRYGWADNPRCNLYNREGLPASPFRTDDWDGVTVGRHY